LDIITTLGNFEAKGLRNGSKRENPLLEMGLGFHFANALL
jgi:hypothetical protein